MILHKFKNKIIFLVLALSSQFIFASAEIKPPCKWLLDAGFLISKKFDTSRKVEVKFRQDYPLIADSLLAFSKDRDTTFFILEYIQGIGTGLFDVPRKPNFSETVPQTLLGSKHVENVVAPILVVRDVIQESENKYNLSDHMYIPRPILNFFKDSLLKSSAISQYHILNLPLSILSQRDLSLKENHIIIHEFAHLLFYSNLFNKNLLGRETVYNPFDEPSLCQDSLDHYEKLSSSSTNLYVASSVLSAQVCAGRVPSKDLKDTLINEVVSSYEMSLKIEEFRNKSILGGHKLSIFYKKHKRYAEVYSDFVASVILRDPNIAVRVFDHSKNDALLRCFDVNFEKLFSIEQQSFLDRKYSNNVHIQLYRERYKLWQHFYGKLGKNPGEDLGYDGIVLREAFKILATSLYKENNL